MRKTVPQHIIAGLLLLNHSLMSCYNPKIEPLQEVKVPVIAMEKSHKQSKVEASQDHKPLIVSYAATMVWGDFEEEAIQTVQFDSKRNQLMGSLVSKETTLNSVQAAADNRQQGVKQTHQPVFLSLPSRAQLPPMIIYSSNQSSEQVHRKERQQRMQQLESIQPLTEQERQELHASIVQTLQNPIWKRYVLNTEINTTQLLPDTQLQLTPIRGDYQFACVQGSFQSFVPMLSLQTREKHHIILVQDMGYWWGIIQDKRPVLSRNVVLPVLYPNHANGEDLGLSTQYTVEALMQMDPAVQEQLVHIFSQDRSLKNGFVYTGEEMGLVGGGKGGSSGCNGNVDMAKSQTQAAKDDKEMSEQEKEARKLIAALEKLIETGQIDEDNPSTIPGQETKAQQGIEEQLKDLELQQKEAYKLLPKFLSSTFPEFETNNLNNITKLTTKYKNGLLDNPKYRKYITQEHRKKFAEYMQKRTDHSNYLKDQKEVLIQKAEKQATAAFNKKKAFWDSAMTKEMKKLDNLLGGIGVVPALASMDQKQREIFDPQFVIDKIQECISDYKAFRDQQVEVNGTKMRVMDQYPEVEAAINAQIAIEKQRLKDAIIKAKPSQNAMGEPNPTDRSDKMAKVQNATQAIEQRESGKEKENPDDKEKENKDKEKHKAQIINEYIIDSINAGDRDSLMYQIKSNNIDLGKTVNEMGETFLHIAARANKLEAVNLLLELKAPIEQDAFGHKPSDLTTDPEIQRRLLEVEK